MNIIGMDIGGTNLRIGTLTADGVQGLQKHPTSRLTEGDSVDKLIRFIEGYLAEFRIAVPDAISVGFPASLTADRKHVFCAPNIKNASGEGAFDRANIVDPLRRRFGCPVYLNKDVNNLLYGDLIRMDLLERDCVAAGYIGTGYGGALYVRGELQYGAHNAAMDIGHVSLYGADALCPCGKRGCVETICSGRYLQQIRQSCFPDIAIDDIFTLHSGAQVLRQFVRACAQPFAMMLTMLDPDVILVGGGVPQMRDFPFDFLCDCIRESSSRITASQNPDIRLCRATDDQGVFGAAWYARSMLDRGDA